MQNTKQRGGRPGPVPVYLSELAEGSKRTMRFGLATACRFFAGTDPDMFLWHRVRVDQIAALRAYLASRLAPKTANKILAAVRGELRASWRMALMSAEDLYWRTDVRPVKGRHAALSAFSPTTCAAPSPGTCWTRGPTWRSCRG